VNLYTAQQLREWDAFTATHEPVDFIDLMERAASGCVQWMLQHIGSNKNYLVVCGTGNNGGDGLAIARLLHQQKIQVQVFILDAACKEASAFSTNLLRLQSAGVQPVILKTPTLFPQPQKGDVVIDALFGTGLSRPLEGLAAQLVAHLNVVAQNMVAIDVPSGLLLHQSSIDSAVIRARYTLSFQATKMAFLVPENEAFTGHVAVIDIGLHAQYNAAAPYMLMDKSLIRQLYKPRSRFGHKGSYGHVLVVGGSAGKIGAVVLSAKAALRAGAGLVTALVPKLGYHIVQTALPEAMCITDEGDEILTAMQHDTGRYAAIGIGPGMGTAPETVKAFSVFLSRLEQPVVADADALNCMAQDSSLLSTLPKGSILTPHPKEFERLFGYAANDFERIEKAMMMARQFRFFIVLKGHHTFIATPDGEGYFNSTGNAGMATGGSGDVLTGIIAALLAQGNSSLEACMLGVYVHGLAGDIAAAKIGEESLIASDITDNLGGAFKQFGS
jgi:ADP-dependent NAD(P)H-hydrate dehydratase / NAD(P)H-hydrate epimerase